MSIKSQIDRIKAARDDIASAIEGKGVAAEGSALADLADKVRAIVQSIVKTVNGKSPDTEGNIQLTASDVGARASTWMPTAANVGAVPTSRTVNGKALSANITLTAADVSARPSTWTPTAADVGAVPTTRKVNSKALSADITLAASDVGAVPTSRTVNGKALSSNITLAAADVGAAPTSHASSASTYGMGNASNYGHVKLSDATNSGSGATLGVAATPYGVKTAYDRATIAMALSYNVTINYGDWVQGDTLTHLGVTYTWKAVNNSPLTVTGGIAGVVIEPVEGSQADLQAWGVADVEGYSVTLWSKTRLSNSIKLRIVLIK